jgi:diaminohydroxyphosphoribosylaminopyrimidine deaminase/5-amino-6-(5-phosphoribosylamino)uracil reductase
MRDALALADNALFTATPNPRVGCVIVKGGASVGAGWTQPYGGLHAEQHALANCRTDPLGATAYVTFEPCNQVGLSGRAESCVVSLLRRKSAVSSWRRSIRIPGWRQGRWRLCARPASRP